MTTVYDIFELRAYAVKVYGRGDDQHIGICHLVIYLFHTVFLKALVAFSCKTSVATDTRRDFFVAHRYYFDVVVFVCAVRKRLCQYIGITASARTSRNYQYFHTQPRIIIFFLSHFYYKAAILKYRRL